MLFSLKMIILSVDLIYLIVGYTPSGSYLHLDNIHAVLNIPAGLLGIYSYNIFLGPSSQYLGDSSRKHLGTILLMEYVLFDVLRLFYVFLAGELPGHWEPAYIITICCRHWHLDLSVPALLSGGHLPSPEEYNEGFPSYLDWTSIHQILHRGTSVGKVCCRRS